MIKKVRNHIFLRDVLLLSITSFGGPQAHIAMFLDVLVEKRRYLSSEDLIDTIALCQILPGPTSTQTITAIGFRMGGSKLSYLTLLVWIAPAVTLMTLGAIFITYFQEQHIKLNFMRIIHPMVVGYILFASYVLSRTVIKNYLTFLLMIISVIITIGYASPYIFPLLLVLGGCISALNYKKKIKQKKTKIKINWSNFILWALVFILVAFLGSFTQLRIILLFENFYRNGSLIFGGGQVLIPFLFSEFVELKNYLSSDEFLFGYAIMQSFPGPVFSFCAYVGSLSMRDQGLFLQILGALSASAGIFLPGTFLIFFAIRFFDSLKKIRAIKASLEGINAVSCGMVIAASYILYSPISSDILNLFIVIITFLLLNFTKIPSPLLILIGVLVGSFF